MRPVELELLVQGAIEARRAGRNVEDDRIEFKSDWPEPHRARQLAGAANTLRGEPLVYVIGVRDNGEVVATTEQEPSDWYASMKAAFDSEAPGLILHRRVQVGDEAGDAVTALAFSTDQYPYVMPVAGVSDRREVPIRLASGTASANRYQLMRLLSETASAPNFEVTTGSTNPRWSDSPVSTTEENSGGRELTLAMPLSLILFVDHTAERAATIPTRDIRARLACGDLTQVLDVRATTSARKMHRFRRITEGSEPEPPPPSHGVYFRDNHVIVISPGEFRLELDPQFGPRVAPDHEMSDWHEALLRGDELRIDIALQVVGAARDTRLSTVLKRIRPHGEREETLSANGTFFEQELGRWKLPQSEYDPWAELPDAVEDVNG